MSRLKTNLRFCRLPLKLEGGGLLLYRGPVVTYCKLINEIFYCFEIRRVLGTKKLNKLYFVPLKFPFIIRFNTVLMTMRWINIFTISIPSKVSQIHLCSHVTSVLAKSETRLVFCSQMVPKHYSPSSSPSFPAVHSQHTLKHNCSVPSLFRWHEQRACANLHRKVVLCYRNWLRKICRGSCKATLGCSCHRDISPKYRAQVELKEERLSLKCYFEHDQTGA